MGSERICLAADRIRWLRRLPAQCPNRRLGITDAEKFLDVGRRELLTVVCPMTTEAGSVAAASAGSPAEAETVRAVPASSENNRTRRAL